ncbi:MAG TPA: SMR family transporter [Egibacteraceae bacterium]
MAWLTLILSGVLEAVWAAALSESEGFTRPLPTVVFAVALTASMAGLAYAMRTLPVGTAYAVWVGIGAVGAALYGIVVAGESASAARLVCLALIVAGVAGLRFLE